MRVYHVAGASMALCAGLLLASFAKAAEVEIANQVAQMNRSTYAGTGEVAQVYVPPRRPHSTVAVGTAVAQMNRVHYAQQDWAAPKPVMKLPRRPVSKPADLPVVSAQMNRALYD